MRNQVVLSFWTIGEHFHLSASGVGRAPKAVPNSLGTELREPLDDPAQH